MPAVIDEGVLTPELAAPVSVPVGADNRTAASLLPAWTGIIKRLMFLEEWYDALKVLTLGGTLEPAGAVDLDLTAGPMSVTQGTFVIEPAAYLQVDGTTLGRLFTAGESGRANKKITNAAVATNQLINPLARDTYAYLTSAAIDAQVSVAEANLKDGDWFRVVCKVTSSGAITVKNTAGVTLHVVPVPAGGLPTWREYAWHAATSAWVLTDCSGT